MKKFLIYLIFIFLTGCATIMNGTTQEVSIKSNPKGAMYIMDTYDTTGITPITLNLKRSDTHKIKIVKDGYYPQFVTIEKNISKWAIGNILFGGFLGLAVDAYSGGLYYLNPDEVDVKLQKRK